MARLLKVFLVFLLWTGVSDHNITRVGAAELHVKVTENYLLELQRIPEDEERVLGKIKELQMAIESPNKIFMTTESLFASASVVGDKGVITPESRFSPEQIFSATSKFSGFIQHEAKYILFVSPGAGCIVRSSLDDWKINEVIAGKCGVNEHADGYLKSARLQRPTRIVKNPTSSLSYFVLDKSKIKNMDLIAKNLSTIQDFNQTTIIDIAVNGRGVVFALARKDQAAYLSTFSLFEPNSKPQTITSSSKIHSDFLFSSPLFGTSLSSLAFVGDDMLVFTDPSNQALKVVRTMKSNTSGLLTICQPFGKPTIEFIDSDMPGHHCNKSFSPSLVRSQEDKILVLSENKVIIFKITESNDDTKTIDVKTLAVHISYSSLVGVLSIIVVCLSIKYHKIKMRHGQEKRRHALDISFPLQDTAGIYFIESPPSVRPRSASTRHSPAANDDISTRHQLRANTSHQDTATCNNPAYSTTEADSVIYEMMMPSNRPHSAISDDDESFHSAGEQITSV